MSEFITKILSIEKLTHDVNRIRIERPDGYIFTPGQVAEVSINSPHLKNEKRPFSFTGPAEARELEFIIKSYDEHDGMTKNIENLKPGNELIIGDPWGTISYHGRGIFFAAGSGVTPFIAIFRDLKKKQIIAGNVLFLSNKTESDIILKDELEEMLKGDFINILTRERKEGYYYGRIDGDFLRMNVVDVYRNFYICGPDEFVKNINSILLRMGAAPDSITIEK